MEKEPISYISTDDGKIINERHIIWIKKMNNCLEICSKKFGCYGKSDTDSVCREFSLKSFNKLNNNFKNI